MKKYTKLTELDKKIDGSKTVPHWYTTKEFPLKSSSCFTHNYLAFLAVENCSKRHNSARKYATAIQKSSNQESKL